MRFSYRWLREYVQVQKPLQEILEGFTMSGLEVETTLDLGMLSGKIIVGRILKIAPHPNADNLRLCTVDIGRERPLNIVCGAQNMKEGDKAVVALEGAQLHGGNIIQHSRIRGEVSEGMLCAGDELGLNDYHSGILILPGDFPIGEPVDAVIDISVTPNRGDCLSILGLARDLAGYFQSRLYHPTVRVNETMERIENYLKVTVQNREACPRYGVRYIRGVRVGPSPAWLAYRLESTGVRPLNNIIDATNYVMLELGHPIHAFDLDRVANRHIIVRNAREGEVMETLDGERIPLTPEDLLIADPRDPIALAGVMGGRNSGITPSTINVVLECAYFDPITIRKTGNRLGKQTEASYRFERNVDSEAIPRILDRVTSLIQQLAGGEIVQGIIDVKNYRSRQRLISLSVGRTNQVLGVKLRPREIADLLVGLGFEITSSDTETLTFAIPSFRNDITREIDLIEEVARMYGYQKIKPTLPYLPSKATATSSLSEMMKRIRETLLSLRFDEAITYSFTSSRLSEALGAPVGKKVVLTNPISSDQDMMRSSLLPGFVECVAHNLNRDVLNLSLFEIGKIYSHGDSGPEESVHLIAGLCGDKEGSWRKKAKTTDFYDIKGAAMVLLDLLGFADAVLEPLKDTGYYHPKRSDRYILGELEICRFGELHPLLTERLELKRRLYFLEMNLSAIAPHARKTVQFQPIPRFPSITRDLAVVLDEAIPALDVIHAIREAAGADLENLTLFDLYRGDPVPAGKKSLAYSLVFRASDRTLTDAEINPHMESIFSALKERFNATLR